MLAVGITISFPLAMIGLYEAPAELGNHGATIYKVHCKRCHGGDGRGENISANFVEDRERMAKSDKELIISIREGLVGRIGYMPAWAGILTEEQIVAVLSYIRQEFQENTK